MRGKRQNYIACSESTNFVVREIGTRLPTSGQLRANTAKPDECQIGLFAFSTRIAMGADGMRDLRKSSNGWVCVPDDPNTPGGDPMCADPVVLQCRRQCSAASCNRDAGIGIAKSSRSPERV